VTTTAVTGAAPSTNSSAGNELTGDIWRVVYVYDGDTMQVERGGVREKVRIIGIDTTEKGKCGADEARVELEKLLGQDVSLIPGAKTDRDPYDRLLRYVEWPTDGDDFGLHMIEDGYAIARFDRRSNQPHDREDAYIAADAVAQRICPDSAWDRGY
jgi:endonuclease YncB( thermonuclease family)